MSRTIPYLKTLSRTIAYLKTLSRTHTACAQNRKSDGSQSKSSTKKPFNFFSQSESRITSPDRSRLRWGPLLGSRISIPCLNTWGPPPPSAVLTHIIYIYVYIFIYIYQKFTFLSNSLHRYIFPIYVFMYMYNSCGKRKFSLDRMWLKTDFICIVVQSFLTRPKKKLNPWNRSTLGWI